MRATPFVTALLGLAIVAGCSSQVDRRDGEAAPAGTPDQSASAATSAPPASTGPAGNTSPGAAGQSSAGSIRNTDWRNVTLTNLTVGRLGTVTFRDGSTPSGYYTCQMLPGGAKPVYGHFLNEEPASAPKTEDALVLLQCGGDVQSQALIPVQLDGTKLRAVGAIEGEKYQGEYKGPGATPMMTFTAYQLGENGIIVATVKKLDGKTETRRYGWGGNGWDRL